MSNGASQRVLFRATDESHRVTTLELFFDLVFVFAMTQVTQLMADDLTLRGAFRGLVLLALLWWAWCSYAWLGNQAKADEGLVRAAMMLAAAALFLVALGVPEAWADHDGGVPVPLMIASCIAFVRLLHLSTYLVAGWADRPLRRQLFKTAVPVTIAAGVLIAGGLMDGTAHTVLWVAALAIDYVGVYVTATDWRVHSPGHFAERHGLIVLIAIGESMVAIGFGVAQEPLTWPVVAAAMMGLTVSVALWWLYFDVVALVAERMFAHTTGQERVKRARDSYTFLHLPMVAGIIFLALGLKKIVSYVADTEHHSLSDALHGVGLWALFGGVAVYLLALVAFRLRNVRTVNKPRLMTALLLLPLAALMAHAPALATLGAVAVVLTLLVTYEVVHHKDARREMRAGAEMSVG